jgi:hypothetical protein
MFNFQEDPTSKLPPEDDPQTLKQHAFVKSLASDKGLFFYFASLFFFFFSVILLLFVNCR